jgi:hypothetical protein
MGLVDNCSRELMAPATAVATARTGARYGHSPSRARRTYKLTVADPLPTSYGQDIYYRIGGRLGEQPAPAARAASAE